MQEHLKERLSLMLDDELDAESAASLLATVSRDKDLQAKLQRYSMISQALKENSYAVADAGFAAKVAEQLKSEPVYFLPQKRLVALPKKAAVAVAASVAMVVIGWASLSILPYQSNPFNSVSRVAQVNLPAAQSNARFKEYLQAHDNVWYVNDAVANPSHARLASYQHQ
ncbi:MULTISPECIES: sigma-E factor negative regulatory protein [Methylomonas]|uniref:sigma-E factor negative regulatory protein n=1 Tax=Methylomonas TaxID=416 RepID=UPI0012327E40|nr:sigma-E factor negative regulatory protein [Methylomonas rhizoryzae]